MQGRGQDAFLKAIDLSDVTTDIEITATYPSRFCIHGSETTLPDATGASGGRGVSSWPQGFIVTGGCYTYYYDKGDGSAPLIGRVTTGC